MSETREDVDKMQGTLVFFDLETNGLIDRDGRGNIHHCPDIIELAMVAVSRESIEQNHPIRAIDKGVPGGRERLYCFPLFAHGQLITTSVTSHSNRSKLSLAWLV